MAEIDQVAFHEKPLIKFDRALETFLARAPGMGGCFGEEWKLFSENSDFPNDWKQSSTTEGRSYASHYESHAASAFYVSPFESSAILTADGVGEWETNTIAHGKGIPDLMCNLLFLILSDCCIPHLPITWASG